MSASRSVQVGQIERRVTHLPETLGSVRNPEPRGQLQRFPLRDSRRIVGLRFCLSRFFPAARICAFPQSVSVRQVSGHGTHRDRERISALVAERHLLPGWCCGRCCRGCCRRRCRWRCRWRCDGCCRRRGRGRCGGWAARHQALSTRPIHPNSADGSQGISLGPVDLPCARATRLRCYRSPQSARHVLYTARHEPHTPR